MNAPQEQGVLLDAYAARSCPRRTHNAFDASMGSLPIVGQNIAAQAQQGLTFQEHTYLAFAAALGAKCLDLTSERNAPPAQQIEKTRQALAAGVDLVLGGWLPDDPVGGRKGRPDLLIRGPDQPDGRPGYHAGDVKAHLMTKPASVKKSLRYSVASGPSPAQAFVQSGRALQKRTEDWLQVAHYHRMLQAAGFATPGPAQAALVGTDVIEGDEYPLIWVNLDEPRIDTYSRSSSTGQATRSVLEHYDHQFHFRQDIAARAIARSADPGLPPLVLPILQEECGQCPWREVCPLLLPDDDANRQLPPVTAEQQREWVLLRAAGVTTLAQLAALDLEGPEVAGVLAQVHGAGYVRKRIATMRRKADLVQRGVMVERTTTGEIELATHDVEIDFDIEWRTDQHVYLYGFLVNDGSDTPFFHHISSFDAMTEISAAALAQRAVTWLADRRDVALLAGQTFCVYHYANPEISQVRKALGASDERFEDLVAQHFCDLVDVVRKNFDGVWSLGLKQVAPVAGWQWRDEDPGGRNSMVWADEAVNGDAVSQQRVLDYNEDDVRATLAVRRWIRAQR